MDTKTKLDSYLAWFKAHERLVALVVAGFFGVHFYGKGIDYLVKRDQTQAQIATQQAQAAANRLTSDQEQNVQLLSQLASLQQQVIDQNKRIDQAMRDRATQTQAQKHTDDQASSSELATRIHTLLGVGTIKVEQQTSPLPDQLVYSLDAAHADADNLEDLQQSRLDVKDLNTKLAGCQSITDKQANTIIGLNNTIDDGKNALVAEQKSHALDVKTLKQEKRKSWLNGFKWGVVTGFLGSLFVHKP